MGWETSAGSGKGRNVCHLPLKIFKIVLDKNGNAFRLSSVILLPKEQRIATQRSNQ